MQQVKFRPATGSDTGVLCEIANKAFGDEGEQIAALVDEMSSSDSCMLWLIENKETRGFVGASQALLGSDSFNNHWVLAPLGVRVDSQSAGLGGTLVLNCLEALKSTGAAGVFVYGDPGYYSRFGFQRESTFTPIFELEYPEAWQAIWWQERPSQKKTPLRVEGPLNNSDLW